MADEEGDDFYEELSDDDFGDGEEGEPSFADFCKNISMLSEEELDRGIETDRLSKTDKMSMFTVNERYSGGSVEVSRGSRMSVFPGAQVRKNKYSRMTKIAGEAQKKADVARKTCMKLEKKRPGLQRQATETLAEV